GLPLRAPSRSGPRRPCRPPQPHAQVHKSARFLRPPRPCPGRRRRLLREAARPGPEVAGRRRGRRVPSPGASLRPRGGWVGGRPSEVSSAGFLRNYDGSPAPVFCCLFPLALSCSLPLPSPFPRSSLPRRPKRQAKPAADEGFWDCSVCTFRNSAEAFKCSICDVRKGTSTRKPRINSQLVAQQVAQQYATPPPPKKEKKEKVEKQDKEKPEKDKEISPSVTKKNTNKKTKPKSDILKDPPSEANSIQSANATTKTSETNHTSRPRLKNVDRSTAQQLAVTVGNVTVIITDFKEKTRSSSTSSSTVTSSAGSEQQNQSSSGSESTDKGSSRSSTPKGDMSAVNDESF
uniref:RING1 and YY1 binding protein n=1 Tax=Equus caballus TaxID=9796 RepID=A0A9L0SRZ6_HORSE